MLRLLCIHIPSWQCLPHRWLRHLTVYLLVYITVLTISVLGPLACIIHCHLLPHFFSTSNTSSASTMYFCQLLAISDSESTPPPLPLLPSSVYPLTLVGLSGISLLKLRSTRYIYVLHCRPSQTTYLPPTPPPRCVLLPYS